MIDLIRQILLGYKQREWEDLLTENIQHAAVLLPLTYRLGELIFIFTRRADNLASHAGQVSFPGGVREFEDKTPIDTALRETYEEIGILTNQIEILGMMPPYHSTTGFYVYPVVGFIRNLNGLKRNTIEVEKLLCVPYKWLMNPENYYQADYQTKSGSIHRLWFFKDFEGEKIWGLTAQITLDFMEIIKK